MGPQAVFCARLLVLRPVGLKTPVKDALEGLLHRTLAKIKIPTGAKGGLLNELHRMNINRFTIFNDLDSLSKDIKRVWKIK